MDTADLALPLAPFLIGLTAAGCVRPDRGGRVVVRHGIPEPPPVEPGTIGDLALADEAKGPADREAALAAEAGDRDVDTGPAIGYRQPSGLPGCCVAWARPAQPSPDPIFHTQRR